MGLTYGLAANATTRQHSQQRGGEPRTEWEGALDEALTGELFIDPATSDRHWCVICLRHRAKHQAYTCPLCEGVL